MVEIATSVLQPTAEGLSISELPAFLRRYKEASGQRFAREETIYSDPDEEFGVVFLRIEPGAHPRLSPVELATFVQACFDYALLEQQINELKKKQAEAEATIKGTIKRHEGLVGIESRKLDKSVGYEPSVSLTPNPELLRKETGDAFPSIAKEELGATMTIPEGIKTRDGSPLTAATIKNFVELAFEYAGVSRENQLKSVKWEHKAVVHEGEGREKLYELARSGTVSVETLGANETRKMQVRPLSEKPKKAREKKSSK